MAQRKTSKFILKKSETMKRVINKVTKENEGLNEKKEELVSLTK
jgi:hypothetical protein